MKCALIFPPQWDPRQPPLSIPTIAGVLKSKGHEVKAWDVNLYLYWQLIFSRLNEKKIANTLKQYLRIDALKDAEKFSKLNSELEYAIYSEYDETENHQLYWDNLHTPYSANKSDDWKTAVNKPENFPFFERIKSHIEEIIEWNPDIIFISCISDTQIFSALSIASHLRASMQNVKIMVGGHAFIQRKNILIKQSWLFKTIDAICFSNGEPSIIAISEGKPLDQVPNILWFNNNKIQSSINTEPFEYNDSFKPDFSVLPMKYYLSPTIVIPIETARGCPWSKCAFCNHPLINVEQKMTNNQSIRSLLSVINEMKEHITNGYKSFAFVDEALSYDRFKNLSSELSNLEEDLTWICYLRLEQQHNIAEFKNAKKAGCKKIFFGLETGSDRLLKLYKKGTTSKIAKRVLKEASAAGIAIHLFIITGFAKETDTDRAENEELLKEILPVINTFGFTYDIFPLSVAIDTSLYLKPKYYGASIKRNEKHDLTSRFNLYFPKETRNVHSEYNHKIKQMIESYLKGKIGIRNLKISHDSMHLLLIDSHCND